MPGRLRRHVHLNDPETHARTVFGPGDEVPDWAAALITNPHAWAEPPEGAQDAPPRPALTAGKPVWDAFAQALGVEVPDGATKAEIIELCDR